MKNHVDCTSVRKYIRDSILNILNNLDPLSTRCFFNHRIIYFQAFGHKRPSSGITILTPYANLYLGVKIIKNITIKMISILKRRGFFYFEPKGSFQVKYDWFHDGKVCPYRILAPLKIHLKMFPSAFSMEMEVFQQT